MKRSKKKQSKCISLKLYLSIFLSLLVVGLASVGISIKLNEDGSLTIQPLKLNYTLSDNEMPAVIEAQGELIEIDNIPTVEEVDGGLFEDKDTGVSTTGEYEDLGANIETFDTSTPEAFKNETLNRCVYANNKYGAQCVSLARSFWFSYAGRDVSTCGTGMAKGMMNCADQNAGDDFLIFWADSKNQIEAGDWLVFDGGQYGHVGMALAPVVNGYVTLLGENQGGIPCDGGGSATNIININIKNLIGFYRPKAYIKPVPTPEPVPQPIPDKCKIRTVLAGDTMGKIMKECLGEIKWGAEMNEYASRWHSIKFKTFNSVLEGWQSKTGYGLFAEDIIEYR